MKRSIKCFSILHRNIHTISLYWKGWLKSYAIKSKYEDFPIDFVVTWVDGNDPHWQEEKNKYAPPNSKGNTAARYREWNQFMYWFRAVEKYAPWVHKVYLVTCGHVPSWLNLDHPKLEVVSHAMYMNEEYLPTFSSIPIELNIHKIPGLSEHFVYFNDDMYLSAPVTPETFYEGGLPKLCGIAYPIKNYRYNGPYAHQLFSNIGMINGCFQIDAVIEKHPELWFHHVYGKDRKYNYAALKEYYLPGMFCSHLGCPYRKSTIEQVWKTLQQELHDTSKHKFRLPTDIMHSLFSCWEIMNGTFTPVSSTYYGKKFESLSTDIDQIDDAFCNETHKMVCLNDSIDITEENFADVKQKLDSILQKAFPQKSKFEK